MTLEIKCPPRPFQAAERAAEKRNDKDIKITNPNPANISIIFFERLHSVTVGHAEKSSLSTNRRGFAHWGSPIKTRKWIKFSFAKAIWLHSGVGPETTRDQVKFPVCAYQKKKKKSCSLPQLFLKADPYSSPNFSTHTTLYYTKGASQPSYKIPEQEVSMNTIDLISLSLNLPLFEIGLNAPCTAL